MQGSFSFRESDILGQSSRGRSGDARGRDEDLEGQGGARQWRRSSRYSERLTTALVEKVAVRGVMVVASGIDWTAWLPIVISALALLGTLGNFGLLLWRGRKHVSIRSSIELDEVDGKDGPPMYVCNVTNTGYIGVQIDRVELRPASGSGAAGIVLRLPQGEQPKKLDQGESQKWGMYIDEAIVIYARRGEGAPRASGELRVVAVAVDTTGKEYVQEQQLALPIHPVG